MGDSRGFGLVVCGIIILKLGLDNFLLRQRVLNTPTSKVRSAAVGLVELSGKVKSDNPLVSPVSKEKCVFWSVTGQFRKSGHSGWRTVYAKSSIQPFYLEDDTGKILVDPKDANLDIPADLESEGGIGWLLSGPVLAGVLDKRVLDFINNEPDAEALRSNSGYVRVVESYVAQGDSLYVLGTATPLERASPVAAENLVIARSKTDDVLYLSDSSEKILVGRMRLGAVAGVVIGIMLSAAGLLIALV